jgi:DNA gyrase subunit A
MPGPADDCPVSVDLDAILAGARVMLGSTQERVHILHALLAAIDQNERVMQVIVASESASAAQSALMTIMGIDQLQARAILDMQYRRLASGERDQLAARCASLAEQIAEYQAIIASPELRRQLAGTEQAADLIRRGMAARD